MPKFNQIELFLDKSYSKEEQAAFVFKSRSICNYLERSIRDIKFETSMSRINIYCTKDDSKVRVQPLKGVPYLEVCIKYDITSIFELDEISLQRHYIKIITSGLKAAQDFMPIPLNQCAKILEKFESDGFVNEWIQAKKEWKKIDVSSVVIANLTMEKFSIFQKVYRGDVLLAGKLVAETKPREMIFNDYLGELSIEHDHNIVYRTKNMIYTKFNLDSNKFMSIS